MTTPGKTALLSLPPSARFEEKPLQKISSWLWGEFCRRWSREWCRVDFALCPHREDVPTAPHRTQGCHGEPWHTAGSSLSPKGDPAQPPWSTQTRLTPLLFFLACICDVVVGDTDLETWLERKKRELFLALAGEKPPLHMCFTHVCHLQFPPCK